MLKWKYSTIPISVLYLIAAFAAAASETARLEQRPPIRVPLVLAQAEKATAPAKVMRMAFTSPADFGALPIALAVEKMKESGVELKPTFFNGFPPARTALLRGDVEIMQLNLNSMITSNQQGANLRALMRMAPNEWVLVTPTGIKTPADLNGKRIGIHGPATLTEQLVKATIKKYSLNSNVLVVPGSDARIQALISKQLDATPAELADFLELRQTKPRDYHAVIDYGKEYPFLTGSTLITRKEYTDQDPALLQTFVSTYVEITNAIRKNPEGMKPALRKAAASFLPKFDMNNFDAVYKQHLSADYWNPLLTRDMAEKTIQFMKDTDQLKGDSPAAEATVDLRFLEKANQGKR
ncbi:MAG TPA: ABC transporter substrate-binding protein [Candidatus Binatia bacterium]|jgi:NitT/TauT family transport system substrate-binding protein